MSSGIYFYRLNTGTLTETKTMTLIKWFWVSRFALIR
jgi:hypothetical protein